MKVLIASGNSLHVAAISGLLSTATCSLIHTTACYDEIIRNSDSQPFDVIVLCRSMPQKGFLSSIDQIQQLNPTSYLVTLVSDSNPAELAAMVTRRVSILHVGDAFECLVEALLRIHDPIHKSDTAASDPFLSPRIIEVVGLLPPAGHAVYVLTNTELKIASLILQGYSNKSISSVLFRSQQTIESHRKHIKDKLNLHGGKNALLEQLIPYTCWVMQAAQNEG